MSDHPTSGAPDLWLNAGPPSEPSALIAAGDVTALLETVDARTPEDLVGRHLLVLGRSRPPSRPKEPPAQQPAEEPARPRRASQSKHKLSTYRDPGDTARLRAAYRLVLAQGKDRSFSDVINRVLMTEVERLEAQHNGGQPLHGVGAGVIPTGRPVGE